MILRTHIRLKRMSAQKNDRSPFLPNEEDSETRIPSSPHQNLPRVGKVASEASRIGF